MDGDIESSRGFIGDDEVWFIGHAHRNEHALSHAAGELVRVVVYAPGWIGDADEAEEVNRLLTQRCARDGPVVHLNGFANLLPHGVHRVQCSEGVLGDQ